jgi:hypothetical protein
MKKNSSLLILSLAFFFFSCEKGTFRNSMSVSEFQTFTNARNTTCTEKLNHDGEQIALTGYVFKINVWQNGNRFFIYESTSLSSLDLEVHVKDNSEEIFEKLSEKLSNSDMVKISIRGKISSEPLYINGGCLMGAFIDIDNDNDIRFE